MAGTLAVHELREPVDRPYLHGSHSVEVIEHEPRLIALEESAPSIFACTQTGRLGHDRSGVAEAPSPARCIVLALLVEESTAARPSSCIVGEDPRLERARRVASPRPPRAGLRRARVRAR